MSEMLELKIDALEPDPFDPLQGARLTLREDTGTRSVHMLIGRSEAGAIYRELQGEPSPRPMTHDLLCNIIGDLGGRVLQVAIVDLKEDTYFAELTIQVDSQIKKIDCRPSDGVAIAVRCRVPILISDELLATIEREHEAHEELTPSPGSFIVDTGDTTIH